MSCSLDETIRVWNLNSGQCLKILNEYTKITCLKVFSDEKIISGSDDQTIKIWDIETGVLKHYLKIAILEKVRLN